MIRYGKFQIGCAKANACQEENCPFGKLIIRTLIVCWILKVWEFVNPSCITHSAPISSKNINILLQIPLPQHFFSVHKHFCIKCFRNRHLDTLFSSFGRSKNHRFTRFSRFIFLVIFPTTFFGVKAILLWETFDKSWKKHEILEKRTGSLDVS